MTSLDDNNRADPTRGGSVPVRRPIPPPPRRAESSINPATDTTTSRINSPESTTSTASTTLTVRAWIDPVVDDGGYDPRSRYVEQFWLGVLGPTATWLLRRLVAGLERHPDGYEIDLELTAKMMGLSYTSGRASPFSKALGRCTMFGLAHQTSDGMAVRRRVPAVAHRHLRRMPEAVQRAHDEWMESTIDLDSLNRAHRLALAMLEAGDDAAIIEHHLVAIGVADVVAAEVADNAMRL